MIVEKITKLIEKWIVKSTKELKIKEKPACDIGKDNNGMIRKNSFIGFAVSSAIKTYTNLQIKAAHNDVSTDYALHTELRCFVTKMRILHEDALMDPVCMSKYYSIFDYLESHGGKTLIPPNLCICRASHNVMR